MGKAEIERKPTRIDRHAGLLAPVPTLSKASRAARLGLRSASPRWQGPAEVATGASASAPAGPREARFACPTVLASEAFADDQALLQLAEKHGLEGVVSKRRDAPYRSGACRGGARSRRRLGARPIENDGGYLRGGRRKRKWARLGLIFFADRQGTPPTPCPATQRMDQDTSAPRTRTLFCSAHLAASASQLGNASLEPLMCLIATHEMHRPKSGADQSQDGVLAGGQSQSAVRSPLMPNRKWAPRPTQNVARCARSSQRTACGEPSAGCLQNESGAGPFLAAFEPVEK
jgi:hypothetical protein